MTKKLKNIWIIIIILIGVALIILGAYDEQIFIPKYSYRVQKNCNYQVLLKPNSLYDEKYLESSLLYASNSIESFIINMQYNYKGDKKTKINYKYNINANLVGDIEYTDESNKEIWNKLYILLEEKNISLNNANHFLLNENINIDYENYMNLVRLYEQTYGIKIQATLKVRLNVAIDLNLDNVEEINDYIELDIPINDTVTEGKENYDKELSKILYQNVQIPQYLKLIFLMSGILLVIVSLIIILIIIKKAKNNQTKEEIYKHNMKYILKYYKDLLVTVTNEPDLSNLKIMNIEKLEDLVDIAEQNQVNIVLYELAKGVRCNLYVFINNYGYIYEVNNIKVL